MAFGLTSFKAYGIEISEPVQKRAHQVLELSITGTTADVDLNFSDVTGTMWTSIDDTATGLAAKKAMTEILAKVDKLVTFRCPQIEWTLTMLPGSTTGTTTKYAISGNTANTCPLIKLYAGEGLTAYSVVFIWSLNNDQRAVRAGW